MDIHRAIRTLQHASEHLLRSRAMKLGLSLSGKSQEWQAITILQNSRNQLQQEVFFRSSGAQPAAHAGRA
jgi:hypothetical protein